MTKKCILIVDDNPTNISLLEEILTENGYQVLAASNGSKALKVVERRSPDLILLDVMMPNIDGYEVCRQLKLDSKTQRIPIIFLSALGEPINKIEGFKVGGVDYITKPFNMEELLSRVGTHIALRQAQNKLEETNQFLAQVNQEKNEFLNIVAHDLKNPLSNILIFSGHLIKRKLEHERVIELAKMISNSGKQMFKLVDDLLDISLIEAGQLITQKTTINVHSFLMKLVDELKSIAEAKELQLELKSEQTNAFITGDEIRLHQIFENLIGNAIKFSPPQKAIYIKIEPSEEQVMVSIQDEGPGFSQEDQTRLYQKFARLSAQPTGGETTTGLGLSIVKRLVDAMDGEIHCQSVKEQGACFSLFFPKLEIEK